MKNSFLDYYKLILEKVSFDNHLLTKEYQKALKALTPDEKQDFHRWIESKSLDYQLALHKHTNGP